MELKFNCFEYSFIFFGLLIEPYGIEISMGNFFSPLANRLLIEPYGIEITMPWAW